MPPDHLEEPTDSVPRPTYAPIAMAMGIAMTAWGLMALTLNIAAMWCMSAAGVGLAAWALKHWIDEIVLQWDAKR